MTRDELLESLLIERQISPWWVTKPETPAAHDDDLTIARRRREALREQDSIDRKARA